MTKILLLFSILISSSSFAIMKDDELTPIHTQLVGIAGIHLASSAMKGTSALGAGPILGLGYRFERDIYFFTPEAEVIPFLGLEKSLALIVSGGFIAGAHLFDPLIDLYGGIVYRSILSYKVEPSVLGRVGVAFSVGMTENKIFVEGLLGQYTERTKTKITDYQELGLDAGLVFPF